MITTIVDSIGIDIRQDRDGFPDEDLECEVMTKTCKKDNCPDFPNSG